MLLSVVSFLVVAQSSSEVPEGLMNNPVFTLFYECWAITHPSKFSYDRLSEQAELPILVWSTPTETLTKITAQFESNCVVCCCSLRHYRPLLLWGRTWKCLHCDIWALRIHVTRLLHSSSPRSSNEQNHLFSTKYGYKSHCKIAMNILGPIFPGHLISRYGDIAWPVRSPDLSVCGFNLWGCIYGVERHTYRFELVRAPNNNMWCIVHHHLAQLKYYSCGYRRRFQESRLTCYVGPWVVFTIGLLSVSSVMEGILRMNF